MSRDTSNCKDITTWWNGGRHAETRGACGYYNGINQLPMRNRHIGCKIRNAEEQKKVSRMLKAEQDTFGI